MTPSQQTKEWILTQLPTLMRTDTAFRQAILDIGRSDFADKVETEDRFTQLLNRLDRQMAEDRRKWEENQRKWEENQKELVKITTRLEELTQQLKQEREANQRQWEENRQRWADNDRQWEENRQKWADNDRQWEKNRQRWADNDRQWEENRQKWAENRQKWTENDHQWAENRQRWVDNDHQWAENRQRWVDNDRQWAENRQRWANNDRQWEENRQKWAENDRRWTENDRQWAENRKEHFEMRRDIKKLDQTVGAVGARWGVHTEITFRHAIAGILKEFAAVEVIHLDEHDDEGIVFGYPEEVELDLMIKNGILILGEIKSSIDKNGLYIFEKKVRFYEKKHGKQVDRKIIISPMVDKKVWPAARNLGIDVYSYVEEVNW